MFMVKPLTHSENGEKHKNGYVPFFQRDHQYVRIELGRSTAEDICWYPCGLNPHGPRYVNSALGKNSMETNLEMKYTFFYL